MITAIQMFPKWIKLLEFCKGNYTDHVMCKESNYFTHTKLLNKTFSIFKKNKMLPYLLYLKHFIHTVAPHPLSRLLLQ